MARVARQRSETGFYHVIVRGNGRQLLFEDDADRTYFLHLLESKTGEHGIQIIAWCLMDNHVHLLLEDVRGEISRAMHGLATAYARHFNEKAGRVGSVFQDRFASVPIETERQLIQAMRYIHENPVKAGVADPKGYRWSSYREYLQGARYINDAVILDIVGGREGFLHACEDDRFAHYYPRTSQARKARDEDALGAARFALDGMDPARVKEAPVAQRDEALRKLRAIGLTVKQMERLTGIGRNAISRAVAGR